MFKIKEAETNEICFWDEGRFNNSSVMFSRGVKKNDAVEPVGGEA